MFEYIKFFFINNYFIYINIIIVIFIYLFLYFSKKEYLIKETIYQVIGTFLFLILSFFIFFNISKKEEKIIFNSEIEKVMKVKRYTKEIKENNKIKRILIPEYYYIKTKDKHNVFINNLNYLSFKNDVLSYEYCYDDDNGKFCDNEKRDNLKIKDQSLFSKIIFEGRTRSLNPKNKIMISYFIPKNIYSLSTEYSKENTLKNLEEQFYTKYFELFKKEKLLMPYPELETNKYGQINFNHFILNDESNKEISKIYKLKLYKTLDEYNDYNPIFYIIKLNSIQESLYLNDLKIFTEIHIKKYIHLNDNVLILFVNENNEIIFNKNIDRIQNFKYENREKLIKLNFINFDNIDIIINYMYKYIETENKFLINSKNFHNDIKYFNVNNLKLENFYQLITILIIMIYNLFIIYLFKIHRIKF
jgi:hypothetical protein